jgi:rhodanese-related sulfurtransferase
MKEEVRMKRQMLTLCLGAFLSSSVFAIDLPQDKVAEVKRTETRHYLTPQEAYDFITKDAANTLFIDVRTPAELQFVGYTDLMDANIPYLTYDYSDWDDKAGEYKRVPNSGFASGVEEALAKKGLSGNKNARIVVMCRSGDRSAKAVDLLAKMGYTNVWSQLDGFEGDKAKDGETKGQRTVNGWKNAKLPWTYNLNKAKAAYLE